MLSKLILALTTISLLWGMFAWLNGLPVSTSAYILTNLTSLFGWAIVAAEDAT